MTDALALTGIDKQFGVVHALRAVDFRLRRGTLHALLGENGAGKSTLMQVAYGMIRPDRGTIAVAGSSSSFASPLDARDAGLGMVHQHPTAIPALTVSENIALAAGWSIARPRALDARVRALMDRLGLPLDPGARAGALSIALKQRLEILKALAGDATILLLDEPSAVLAPRESDELMERIRRFCADGGSAVLITHKRSEALARADHITVLRRGAVVLSAAASDLDEAVLGEAMIGRSVGPEAGRPVPRVGAPLVSLAHVRVARTTDGAPDLMVPSLVVHGGEIVAVAAIEGNGQHELLRTIAGLITANEGTINVASPIAFVPEDRTTEALLLDAPLTENVVLGVGAPAPWRNRWTIDWAQARERTRELITQYDVRTSGAEAAARSLSGGNQQKLIIARALERHPKVIVMENPTRGLDFDATAFVHAQLRAAAAASAAVIIHSTDLDEVLLLGDRVVTVADGHLREAPDGADRALVGEMMLGQSA